MNIAMLKALALKADKGPWTWSKDGDMWGEGKGPPDYHNDADYREPIIQTDMGVYGPNEATRAYISAVSPENVLALIEIIEKAGLASSFPSAQSAGPAADSGG